MDAELISAQEALPTMPWETSGEPYFAIPAKAGIQCAINPSWMPASAAMTVIQNLSQATK
jgi:hypothetical protein